MLINGILKDEMGFQGLVSRILHFYLNLLRLIRSCVTGSRRSEASVLRSVV
jgi:hypothetical protein